MSESVRTFTDGNWVEEVVSAPGPVLVDFWAAWCPPCRAVAPELERLAGGLVGQVTVGKLDIEANPGTVSRYGVKSIPALVLFEGGQEVDRRLGYATAQELAQWLQRRRALAAYGVH